MTPSALDGVSSELEFAHRVFGCELAQEMTVLLCMPQVCAVTAQTLLQHFYYRRSLRLFDAYVVAMACVFLAGKVEEHTRAMRDILNVCHNCMLRRLDKQQKPLQRGGELYSSWKAALIRCERFVLIDLGFRVYDLSNEHPHKFILYYVLALGGGEELAQRSWNYLNDSLRLQRQQQVEQSLDQSAATHTVAERSEGPRHSLSQRAAAHQAITRTAGSSSCCGERRGSRHVIVAYEP